MEKKPPRPMTPFDELTTPYPLSILKLLLPYLIPNDRSPLWILIKFMELQYTISIFRHPGSLLENQSFGHHPESPSELLDEIMPYLPQEQAQTADTFRSMLDMMDLMKMVQPSDGSPLDLMRGMLSPEQQEMFQMYEEMFSDTDTSGNSKTGDDNYGAMDEQSTSKKHGSGKAGTDSDGSIPDEGEIRKRSCPDSAGPDYKCK